VLAVTHSEDADVKCVESPSDAAKEAQVA